MVDETEFEIMDADHESRMNDSDDVYCKECGEDKELSFIGNYANGEEYECLECGIIFMW